MINISSNLLNFIKKAERFKSKPYFCSADKLTIGYGHVILPSENYEQVTEAQATEILKKDISIAQVIVDNYVTVKLNQNQYDAITSLVFNWRPNSFIKSKGLKYLNLCDFENAKIEFFSKEKGVVNVNGKFSQGLYNRRKAEQKMFNN